VRGFRRSPCAVACTLDLVGDKWSLLVVRDLLRGNVTYGELQNSPEGIPTNILADRLKRLEEARLIAKSAYQEHPVRYAYGLTEKGKALSEFCSRLCDGARNTYRVHGLCRVQRCIPREAQKPLGNRIENHSCGRLHRAPASRVGRGSSIERNWPCSPTKAFVAIYFA
jgi:DNA-binding HxlR family transcriptional regulator